MPSARTGTNATYFESFNLHNNPLKAGSLITHVSQTRKLRHREIQ